MQWFFLTAELSSLSDVHVRLVIFFFPPEMDPEGHISETLLDHGVFNLCSILWDEHSMEHFGQGYCVK